MNGLQLDEGRGPVLVAIDTDTNEDAGLVKNAVADRGNKGYFVIAPNGMTEQLVAEFGPSIVTPPTAPIVIIDSEQSAPTLLPRGTKSLKDLQRAVESAR